MLKVHRGVPGAVIGAGQQARLGVPSPTAPPGCSLCMPCHTRQACQGGVLPPVPHSPDTPGRCTQPPGTSGPGSAPPAPPPLPAPPAACNPHAGAHPPWLMSLERGRGARAAVGPLRLLHGRRHGHIRLGFVAAAGGAAPSRSPHQREGRPAQLRHTLLSSTAMEAEHHPPLLTAHCLLPAPC